MNIANSFSAWLRTRPSRGLGKAQATRRLDLIGVDMAPSWAAERNQTLLPGIAAVVLAALLLVGLRMDVVRMRYASAQSVTLEQELLDEKRSITVQLLRLREPKLLSERAAELGFAKPDRVITLFASTDFDAPSVGAEPRP